MANNIGYVTGTSSFTFSIGITGATFDATGLTAPRTFILPDTGGTISLTAYTVGAETWSGSPPTTIEQAIQRLCIGLNGLGVNP